MHFHSVTLRKYYEEQYSAATLLSCLSLKPNQIRGRVSGLWLGVSNSFWQPLNGFLLVLPFDQLPCSCQIKASPEHNTATAMSLGFINLITTFSTAYLLLASALYYCNLGFGLICSSTVRHFKKNNLSFINKWILISQSPRWCRFFDVLQQTS